MRQIMRAVRAALRAMKGAVRYVWERSTKAPRGRGG